MVRGAAGVGVVVPLGGAVLSEWIGKTPNVPGPSAATENGLEVLVGEVCVV